MKHIKKYTSFILIIIPVFSFFFFFFKYMVNAPVNDDYLAILDYLNKHISSKTFNEKVDLLFSQSNEHRIVYDRIWILLTYYVFGNVNFTLLAFIGNLSFIPITIILYKKFKEFNKEIILFLPVTVLLFNMAFWENMTFAMAVLSNITVIIFALFNFYFLTKKDLKFSHILLAFLCYIMAILTQGGGLFLLPVAIFILLFRRERKKAAIYFIISIIAVILYFRNLQQNISISFWEFVCDYKSKAIIFIFGFLGNAFNYFMVHSDQAAESLGVTSLIGFALFCLFIYISRTGYYKKNLFNYSIMLFVIIVALSTTYTRMFLGVVASTSSRYRIYGVLFLISIYYWYIETQSIQKKQIWILMLVTAGYFFGINLTHYEYLSHREKQTLKGILYYNDGNPLFLNGAIELLEHYKKALAKSAELGVYKFPNNKSLEYYFPYSLKNQSQMTDSGTPSYFVFSVDSMSALSDSQFIEGYGFLIDHSAENQKIYVGLQNTEEDLPVYFLAKSISRYDLNPAFNKLNLKNGGYIARIRNKDIKPGENTLWLMIEVDGEVKISKTDKKLIR